MLQLEQLCITTNAKLFESGLFLPTDGFATARELQSDLRHPHTLEAAAQDFFLFRRQQRIAQKIVAVRRAVIMALMCQGELLFEPMEQAWLIDFRHYFSAELAQLETMAEQGLVVVRPDGVEVTAMGWFFVRGIAMVFDRYLQADRNRARFSRII